jgi:hypothetical protein
MATDLVETSAQLLILYLYVYDTSRYLQNIHYFLSFSTFPYLIVFDTLISLVFLLCIGETKLLLHQPAQ